MRLILLPSLKPTGTLGNGCCEGTKSLSAGPLHLSSVHLEVAGILCSARSSRLGLHDRPRRVLPLPSALQRVSCVTLGPHDGRNVTTMERGLLFPIARIHWPPSTVRRERRDLLRSPPVPRCSRPPLGLLCCARPSRAGEACTYCNSHKQNVFMTLPVALANPVDCPPAPAGFRFGGGAGPSSNATDFIFHQTLNY